MSEHIPSIEYTPPPARVRDAAAVIVVRGARLEDQEVFWVRRGEKVSFSGGYYAFPGGKVDAADPATPIEGCPEDEVGLYVAAIRETFEEAGILFARGASRLDPATLRRLREELLGGASFAALLSREGLTLDAAALTPAGRWLTPDFSPIRFDTRFFLAVAPEEQVAEVIPGELSDGGWIRPRDALARWEAGTALLHPPNHHAHATLAGFAPEAALPRLRRPPFMCERHVVSRIEFQRGVLYYPLRTPTLPPARHTNAYVVGTGEVAVIDPGSPYPDEQAWFHDRLRELQDEGRTIKCILLTHHHGDHVGGALDLSRRIGAPIWASASTAARVPGAIGRLADGLTISLHGPRRMTLRCLLTEGHAAGHLAFLEEGSGAAFVGDLVAQGSTIVIDPPEGDMGVYLESLRRLRDLPARTLYPAHGFPIPDGPSLLDRYLSHREARMRAIEAALVAGPLPLADVVKRVYSDTPRFLHPVAARSALASLLELQKRGRVRPAGDTWEAVA
ncbi:MAG TPA: MBL fold metallo-hydrolase [Vulgatibacter sp.]|nr:MBL fold metallo-hydrolase [Vulgatibacter sp.]